MKQLKQLILTILLITITAIPMIVNADSGFDSNYSSSTSAGEAIMSAGSSGLS